MDMFNWLQACVKDGEMSIDEIKEILSSNEKCTDLFDDFILYAGCVDFVKEELKYYLRAMKHEI